MDHRTTRGDGPAARLTIAGTAHRERGTARRLFLLLRGVRPSRIFVEMSRASLAYRRGPGRAARLEIEGLLRGVEPGTARAAEARALLEVLAVPAELRAAIRYARERPLAERPRVTLADLSRLAVPMLEEIDDWAGEVKGRLDRGEEPVPFEPCPRRAPAHAEIAELEARDRHMARAIRRALSADAAARVLVVCGYEHVAGLSARLEDLRPNVVELTRLASPCGT